MPDTIDTPDTIDVVDTIGKGGKAANSALKYVVGAIVVLGLCLASVKLAEWLLSLLNQHRPTYFPCNHASNFFPLGKDEKDAVRAATAKGAWREVCNNQYYEQFQGEPAVQGMDLITWEGDLGCCGCQGVDTGRWFATGPDCRKGVDDAICRDYLGPNGQSIALADTWDLKDVEADTGQAAFVCGCAKGWVWGSFGGPCDYPGRSCEATDADPWVHGGGQPGNDFNQYRKCNCTPPGVPNPALNGPNPDPNAPDCICNTFVQCVAPKGAASKPNPEQGNLPEVPLQSSGAACACPPQTVEVTPALLTEAAVKNKGWIECVGNSACVAGTAWDPARGKYNCACSDCRSKDTWVPEGEEECCSAEGDMCMAGNVGTCSDDAYYDNLSKDAKQTYCVVNCTQKNLVGGQCWPVTAKDCCPQCPGKRTPPDGSLPMCCDPSVSDDCTAFQ